MEEEQQEQQQQQSEEGRQVHRLPSLNDLLESEVILGDEDAASSSSAGEMHSALEDLSQQSDVKFQDCASTVSASSNCVTPVKSQRLTMSTSCHYEQSPSPSHQQKPNGLPRSTSNLSSRTVPSSLRSRLQVPAPSANRHSTYADGTTSSKNRVSSTSPFASRRSLVPTTNTATTPPSPASSRPAVPPKPVGLSRQPSSLTSRSTTCSASPVASRRMTTSFSGASPTTTTSPAAKSFLAAGKQRSNIVRSTPPKAPGSIPPQSPRYATLGRRPKPSPPGNSSSPSSPGTPTSDISARETKAAADKFATLPRPRKPSANNLPTASPVKESRISSLSSSDHHQYYGTLPRPAKKPINSPTSSSAATASFKPRTIIYMEKSAQTELSERDVRDGMEASLKLRSLSWQQQNSEEVRQLELLLIQSKQEADLLQRELEEERYERQEVQRELEKTTRRVAAMLDSMEGVEREFHVRGDSLLNLETNLQNSVRAVSVLQDQLEAQEAALLAQRLELDRSIMAERTLAAQLQENENESKEMVDFLQAEKLALHDAVRDADTEIATVKGQLVAKEEECVHLVRLAEQRRHELAALQADLKGAEGRTGSVLLAHGAQLSAAALALVKLQSRLDALLQSLLENRSLPELQLHLLDEEKQEKESEGSTSSVVAQLVAAVEQLELASSVSPSSTTGSSSPEVLHQRPTASSLLAGSTSLQDLSDAINFATRRRPPEGREEPNPVVDEELRLAASLVDQVDVADRVLSKLFRVLGRLVLDKDSQMQQLSDEKEQLLGSLSAQTIALQEAKEELDKVRGDKSAFAANYGRSAICWTKTVSQVLETLPDDLIEAHPALHQLKLFNGAGGADSDEDPNANGSG